jgi:hypothetical protein
VRKTYIDDLRVRARLAIGVGRALVFPSAAVEDDDDVGVAHRRKAMSDRRTHDQLIAAVVTASIVADVDPARPAAF